MEKDLCINIFINKFVKPVNISLEIVLSIFGRIPYWMNLCAIIETFCLNSGESWNQGKNSVWFLGLFLKKILVELLEKNVLFFSWEMFHLP